MALRSFSRELQLPMRVWDLATRLFHWSVVVLVAVSYATSQMRRMDIHLLAGYAMLALLVFRLIWGFAGSDTSRFSHFLASPAAGLRHLTHLRGREPDTQVGHNAAGGWMVLLMLLALAVQVGTGLFSNDRRTATHGPLAGHVSKATSDLLSSVHSACFTVLLVLVGLHVLAVIAYAVVKRQNLLRPMITGKKRLPAATPAPRMASQILAAIVLAMAAAVAWAVATQF
jgi:cytochrome b